MSSSKGKELVRRFSGGFSFLIGSSGLAAIRSRLPRA